MQWIADADFPLDLRVRQVGHDGAALDIGPASGHVPRRHAHPELRSWEGENVKESGERETDGESSQAKKQMRQNRGTWEKMRDEYEQDRWKDRHKSAETGRDQKRQMECAGVGGRGSGLPQSLES